MSLPNQPNRVPVPDRGYGDDGPDWIVWAHGLDGAAKPPFPIRHARTQRSRVDREVLGTWKEEPMRAIDCSEGHDTVHLSAETDEGLMEKVRAHATEVHPGMSEEALQGMFMQLVHDE
jgi:hypothetical protein